MFMTFAPIFLTLAMLALVVSIRYQMKIEMKTQSKMAISEKILVNIASVGVAAALALVVTLLIRNHS